MDLTSFLIRIVFLALPGVLTSLLYRKLLGKRSAKELEDILEIAVFSVLSYGILFLIATILDKWGVSHISLTALQAFSDEKIPLQWREILLACFVGVVLAFVAAAVYTHKFIHRIGRFLNVTRRFGDEDVWDFFHNSPDIISQWVYVRDHKTNLVYFGWINTFSESEKKESLY